MIHLLFLDHQRNDPGSCKFITFLYREIPVAGCDHHLSLEIHSVQGISANLQNTVNICNKFNLAFFDIRPMDYFRISCTNLIKDLCSLIFVENPFFFLPYLQMFFSYRKQ